MNFYGLVAASTVRLFENYCMLMRTFAMQNIFATDSFVNFFCSLVPEAFGFWVSHSSSVHTCRCVPVHLSIYNVFSAMFMVRIFAFFLLQQMTQ